MDERRASRAGAIDRLERAVERAERAAEQLESRHIALRRAAEDSLAVLDRLVPADG
jgi:hypothetical protein